MQLSLLFFTCPRIYHLYGCSNTLNPEDAGYLAIWPILAA